MEKEIDNKIKSKGFTLVELLIAISILTMSILAAFTAVSNNVRGLNFSEDQVVAYYLADEATEYIRNVRDENGINNIKALGAGAPAVPWLTGIDPTCTVACMVDSPSGTISPCPAVCPNLRIDSSSGLYGYTEGWSQTQFQRTINVNIISSTEAVVSVTISWTTNGIPKNYVISETIKNWQ